MASVRIGRTDAFSAVEGSHEELVRRGLTLKDLGVDAASGQSFESLNPYTGQAWAMIPDGQKQDVDRAVEAARQALDHPDWKRMPPMQRGHLLRRFADLLQEHAEHLGHVETRDNGKLIREMLGQARALPSSYDYYAGLADKILGDTIPLENTSVFDYTLREPVGSGSSASSRLGTPRC